MRNRCAICDGAALSLCELIARLKYLTFSDLHYDNHGFVLALIGTFAEVLFYPLEQLVFCVHATLMSCLS